MTTRKFLTVFNYQNGWFVFFKKEVKMHVNTLNINTHMAP